MFDLQSRLVRIQHPRSDKPLFELELAGEWRNVAALQMAPASREPELERGAWLLLLVAVWSAPDRSAIPVAGEVGPQLAGTSRVGIRLFDDPAEHLAWCPSIPGSAPTPLWLVLRDGKLLRHASGLLGAEEVVRLVKQSLETDA